MMRLDKYLAEASLGTRKITREYIKDGLVTVNHLEIREPALEIDETKDVIRYLGNAIIHPGKRYYMFHKPQGCITATKDEDNATVLDYFEDSIAEGLFPVGRLDKDTEGLLLLTNDGEFSHRLMHPDKKVDKTYFFWAFGTLDCGDRELLQKGINIGEKEDLACATKVVVTEEGEYQILKTKMDPSKMRDIQINPYQQPVVGGYLTISEGRKHQVKRMLKAVGCYVVYLKRVSIGNLMLDDALKEGQYRELTEDELELWNIRS